MKRMIRIAALALLAALALGMMPAMAAAKERSIAGATLYAGMGDYYLELNNWTWKEEEVTISSSNPKVLQVPSEYSWRVVPKKVGTAKITIKFKLDGKSYKISRKFTVKKYPNAIKKLTINKKSYKLTGDAMLERTFYPNYSDKSTTINVKPASGWKIASVKATAYRMSDGKKTTLKVKNNKAISISKYAEVTVVYTLKKGAEKFTYTVRIEKDCY